MSTWAARTPSYLDECCTFARRIVERTVVQHDRRRSKIFLGRNHGQFDRRRPAATDGEGEMAGAFRGVISGSFFPIGLKRERISMLIINQMHLLPRDCVGKLKRWMPMTPLTRKRNLHIQGCCAPDLAYNTVESVECRSRRTPLFQGDYRPVDGDLAISFYDLIDVFVAGQLLESMGCPVQTVRRKVYARMESDLGSRHPFLPARANGRTGRASFAQRC